MTPTQQDNELRAEVKQILKDGFNYYIGERKDVSSDMKPLDTYCTEHLMQLITADRKRVALEARLQEVEVSIIELERSDDPRFYSKDEAIRSQRARYTQLKAQQEEV